MFVVYSVLHKWFIRWRVVFRLFDVTAVSVRVYILYALM